MKPTFHGQFLKQWKRLSPKQQLQLNTRLKLFRANPFDQRLRNHALKGDYLGLRSIDIAGDLRATYEPIGEDGAFFLAVGTHSQLYR